MFQTLAEKIVVGVVSAIALAALGVLWRFVVTIPNDIFIPKGMIVAFEGYCPNDQWSTFKPATGRFLVGGGDENDFLPALRTWDQLDGTGSGSTKPVNLTTYGVGSKGGEETHVLSVPELAAHSHTTVFSSGKSSPENTDTTSGEFGRMDIPSEPTSTVGKSLPHNNLPPFFAVRFCVKD